MRIQKKSAVMSNDMLDELEPVLAPDTTCSYDDCIEHIHQAIDCLAECAQDDPLAKESIANLSVVLLDLQK